MKVRGSKDCGNSPKNLFVQEMAIAFETGEIASDSVTDSIEFYDQSSGSKFSLQERCPWIANRLAPVEIQVLHAIAHGRTGASNGISILEDGSKHPFSYFFEFKNTTAKCVSTVYRYG